MDYEIGFDNSLYNEKAVEVAKKYKITEWKGELNRATKARLRKELVSFIKTSGHTIGDVITGLVDTGLDDETALLIAQTEITRVFAEAEYLEGKALAKEFSDVRVIKTWFTNNDNLVCETCKSLHGRSVLFDDDFTNGISKPPAHRGCRCWMSARTDILEDKELYKGD